MEDSKSQHGVTRPPSVWLLLGDKQGDNGQVYTIMRALGWPYELKSLYMREKYVWGKPRFKPALYHLDAEKSDPLLPPWPDLIITIGRRPSMAALWVKAQSRGRTRVVLVGKPSGRMADFDLVIASAENLLPPLRNYLPINLPLMAVDEQAVNRAGEAWASRLTSLKKPLIAVLVGGPTNPFVMDQRVTDHLLEIARHITDSLGGTAYFATSRRTPKSLVTALEAQLPDSARLFCWSAEGKENPYRGLLALADGFIVTGDSISMMVEVIRLGKPLAIVPLPTGGFGGLDQARRTLASRLFSPVSNDSEPPALYRIRDSLARAIYHVDFFKVLSSTRNFQAFHEMLVSQGLAVWVGEDFCVAPETSQTDLPRIVSRIHGLMAPLAC